MSNLIKYQFVDLHPSDTVMINNNDKKDNFIPFGKDGGISIETIGQQEAEKAILSLQKVENEEMGAEPEIVSKEEYEKTREEAENLIEEAKNEAERLREDAAREIQQEKQRAIEEGRDQGYQEGWQQADRKSHRKKKNWLTRRETRNGNYKNMSMELKKNMSMCWLLCFRN